MAWTDGSINAETDQNLRSAMDDVNIVKVTQIASTGGPAPLATAGGSHIKHSGQDLEAQEVKDGVQKLEEPLAMKQPELDNTRDIDTLMAYERALHVSESAAAHSDDTALNIDSKADLSDATDISPQNHITKVTRDTADISLKVIVQVNGKVPKSTLDFILCAARCGTLDELRTNITAAGSEEQKLQDATLWKDDNLLRLIKDLNRVTFRLEEDGHVARMNITPTKVDRSCAFPETEYEAWFYRNIVRGNQEYYRVDVKIEV
jgi:hypothetical protein